MLSKEKIVELLNSIPEHQMARDIFVPILKKMGLKGVKFTGGADERGLDIEYYELTEPEKHKSYVGIQFKKGNLIYSGTGTKGSVKDVRNQAEEAFEKEIHDIDTRATHYISRFIVATTGDINETARQYIGKARQKGSDRRIDYWTGDRLAEYVQDHWAEEFEKYFPISPEEKEVTDTVIVDAQYIEDNYHELVEECKKVRSTINRSEWQIVKALLKLQPDFGSLVKMADLLMEMGKTEDYYREEISHLTSLEYIWHADEGGISLSGHAKIFLRLYESISQELEDAGEDIGDAMDIFQDIAGT